MSHLFTVEEVNALIPTLELAMARVQQRRKDLLDAVERFSGESGRPATEITVADLVERRPEVGTLVRELEEILASIESAGGEFKGLDLGLVDFPGEVDGEIVLLCWQYGEKEIGYYHSIEAGFAGRKPIGIPRRLLQ